jgi:LytS/YehU family sensor histidine kinase
MLWSQINPHFLFNSLNSISALTMSDPDAAYDMTIKLSDFLRFSINTRDKQLHTLEEELEVCDRYMDIERTRFGNRIKYLKSVCENCGTVMVPRLIIQPLLENALKHGAYETSGECEIALKCKMNSNLLIINLENSYDPKAVQPKKGRGVGLENIKKRLQLLYPRDGILAIEKQEHLFTVTLQIPVS